MSSESTVAFYGVRIEISDNEIASLEDRTHPILVKALQCGLKSYWGNFGLEENKFILFIGDMLGVLGIENDRQITLNVQEFVDRTAATQERLRSIGIPEIGKIYLEWQPDR